MPPAYQHYRWRPLEGAPVDYRRVPPSYRRPVARSPRMADYRWRPLPGKAKRPLRTRFGSRPGFRQGSAGPAPHAARRGPPLWHPANAAAPARFRPAFTDYRPAHPRHRVADAQGWRFRPIRERRSMRRGYPPAPPVTPAPLPGHVPAPGYPNDRATLVSRGRPASGRRVYHIPPHARLNGRGRPARFHGSHRFAGYRFRPWTPVNGPVVSSAAHRPVHRGEVAERTSSRQQHSPEPQRADADASGERLTWYIPDPLQGDMVLADTYGDSSRRWVFR